MLNLRLSKFPFLIVTHYTILVISNVSKKSVFRKFKASHASHGWEAVNNHMWPDEPVEIG